MLAVWRYLVPCLGGSGTWDLFSCRKKIGMMAAFGSDCSFFRIVSVLTHVSGCIGGRRGYGSSVAYKKGTITMGGGRHGDKLMDV